jgi:acyl-CoA dehydrogenase
VIRTVRFPRSEDVIAHEREAGRPMDLERGLTQVLRDDVRRFLDHERATGAFTPTCDSWLSGWDEEFSLRLAQRGWVGMTIPQEYGGAGRTAWDRYVVIEELLAAGAPVAAHWIADRQIAPALMRYGSGELQRRYLPQIAAGTCFFALGLSEPDAGSDLAAVRTKAVPAEGGWLVSGTKLWTSGAHRAHAIVALLRTSPVQAAARQAGLSQFILLTDQPGVTISPIVSLDGSHHFNEVVFDDAFVPETMVLGTVGNGWAQVTAELAHERSGPERLLSTFPLLTATVSELAARPSGPNEGELRTLGAVLSRLWACRQLSMGVANALAAGDVPEVAAALVKDLGTRLENDLVESARALLSIEPDASSCGLPGLLASAITQAPGFTLRGGTNEVLRSVVARSLGLR